MATLEGTTNAGIFQFWSQSPIAPEGVGDDVLALQMEAKWQDLVNYATNCPGYNFPAKPFTVDDAAVALDPWMTFALPDNDELPSEIRGAAAIMKPITRRGTIFRRQGGMINSDDGDALDTKAESLGNIGTLLENSSMLGTLPEGEETDWKLGETTTGVLGLFYGSTCQFALYPDGKGWSRTHPEMKAPPVNGADGRLYVDRGSSATSGETMSVLFGAPSWSIQQTLTGDLAWVNNQQGNDTVRMITQFTNGQLFSRKGGGNFAEFEDLNFLQVIEGYMDYVWNEFVDLVEESWQFMVDIAINTWDWMAGAAEEAWDWMEGAAEDVWSWTVDAFNAIEDFISGIFGFSASGVVNAVEGVVNDTINAIDDAVDDAISGTVNAAEDVIDGTVNTVEDAGNAIANTGKKIGKMFGL